MMNYPKMPGSRDAPAGPCVAFEKLDGTNLHWDWECDFGWHAFGTRRDTFNLTPDGEVAFVAAHPELHEAADLFRTELATGLEAVFRGRPAYRGVAAFVAFTEFVGPNSFAGRHKADDRKQTVLIDVRVVDGGFVAPDAFVADFGHLPIPRVVYRGRLTGAFLEAVRAGRYGVGEGVVCKGVAANGTVWQVKVKTDAYLARLKAAFVERWEDHWE